MCIPIVPWLVACVAAAAAAVLSRQRLHAIRRQRDRINIILAVGLNIVKGFAGQVTVGHIALMAIGAYASAVFRPSPAYRSG